MTDDTEDDRLGDQIEWKPATLRSVPTSAPDPARINQAMKARLTHKLDGLRAELDRQIAWASNEVEYNRARVRTIAGQLDEQRKRVIVAQTEARRWRATAEHGAAVLAEVYTGLQRINRYLGDQGHRQLGRTDDAYVIIGEAVAQLKRLLPPEKDAADEGE